MIVSQEVQYHIGYVNVSTCTSVRSILNIFDGNLKFLLNVKVFEVIISNIPVMFRREVDIFNFDRA